MGGLGNQLFQIFTTIAYALEHNCPFVFLNQFQLNSGNDGATIRYSYWNTFLQFLRPFLRDNLHGFTTIKELDFTYNKLPLVMNNKNIELFGHFQSYKYFQSYKATILKLIKFDNLKKDLLEQHPLFKVNTNNKIVSIHCRLGDYKQLPNHYIILPINYYINALQYILNSNDNTNLKVVYFCEQSDLLEVLKIIHILKEQFVSLEFINYSNKLIEDWQELLLMSCCNYNIIANSTFSWWAAYLNNNANNIICYPSKWFGLLLSNKNKLVDLFPPNWRCIFFS